MISPTRALFLRALDRKLLRELWSMKGQALAIALVIAGGVAVYLLAAGMLASLEETRRAYYERYRFADVWAPVVRAPNSMLAAIRELDGVQVAEARIRTKALLDMPGMTEPASGEILSLPDVGEPAVNQLVLRRGRLPERGRRDEVVVLQSFAMAHELELGSELTATVKGGRRTFRVVGTALSPEHIYAIAPGQLIPDDRLFGVLWMGRGALAQMVDQDGAFNEVVARLQRGARVSSVIAGLDRLLSPYGAPGAYGRREHISDAFISSEIDQLRTMGRVLPPIFLLVAAFLVNVVFSRLIATQRADIGLMKAFGYTDGAVIAHYLKLVGLIGLFGLAVGAAAGSWLGRLMAGVYTEYYQFPFLVFAADPQVYVTSLGITAVAVAGGAVFAVRRAAALEPATAMAPPPPPDYSRALGASITRWTLLDQQSRMILRQIVRFPARSVLTCAGIAVSGALLIGTTFLLDSVDEMMAIYFGVANRHDVQVAFAEPRSRAAWFELQRAPGVIEGEPYRAVSARLRLGPREERVSLMGLPVAARLSRMINQDGRSVEPPPGGLVLSEDLAIKLGATPGSLLEIEIAEGRRPVIVLPVAAVSPTLVGSGAQMQLADLNHVLAEGPVVSGAFLRIDAIRAGGLYAQLKATPAIASVNLQRIAYHNMKRIMDDTLGVSILLYTGFAALIAIGVVYNSVRISFAERQRELASLRVLGFTRGEVSYILLGEIAFLTILALPFGALLGTGLARYLASAMSSELFRLPFLIHPATYGYSAVVVLVVTALSGLLVRRELDRMDLVAVLKAKD